MSRVGVVGAAGRMGATVCRAVTDAEGLELAVGIDPARAGRPLLEVAGVTAIVPDLADDLAALRTAGAEVVVDFTAPSVIRANLERYAELGVHAVVGTTGLGADDLDALRSLFSAERGLGCIVAPNFAIGAVLMMRFAELAAPWFETGEIIELHHDAKVDAPSGTAMLTASRMAAASTSWADDPTRTEVAPGARGGLVGDAIHVHSVRLRGMIAHQEVLLGTTGQTLTIRHDSYDRASFMPGVVAAVRAAPGRPGLTVGLEAILGL